MSGVLNDCDALLLAAGVRILNPKDAFINLTTSAPGFHMTGAGGVDLAVVTVTADLVALDGNVVFTAQGATLSNATERSVDVNYVSGTGIVTATVVTNGETFVRSCVIPVLRDGATGAGAKIATLIPSAQVFKINKAGANDIASITLDATGQNTTGTPNFTILAGTATLAAGASASQKILTFANMASDSVTVKITLDGQTDQVTIIKVREGLDGVSPVTGFLTNESMTLTADAAGAVSAGTLAAQTGTFKVFEGATDKTGTSVAYSVFSETGCDVSITTAGAYSVASMAADQGTAVLQAVYAGVTIQKTLTLAKARAGASGTAVYVDVSTSGGQVFSRATSAAAFAPTSITLAATPYGGAATAHQWQYWDGSVWVNISGATAATTAIASGAFAGSRVFRVQATIGGTVYTDEITLVQVTGGADGVNAVNGLLSNEAVTLPADASGNVTSVIGAVCALSVYQGITDTSGAWAYGFAPASSASGLAYTISGNALTVTGLAAGVDAAYVDITATRSGYASITKRFSVSKSKQGTGTTGARGAGHYYSAGSAWTDAAADAATPDGSVVGDVVTISSGTFVMEKRWTGSAWEDNGVVINGKLIVPDSILASSIDARGLVIRDDQGNVVISAGGLQPGFEAPDTKNSDLQPAIDAAKSAADAAKLVTDAISENNKLTPSEKKLLVTEWSNINIPHGPILARAAEMGVPSAAFNAAYTNLLTYLQGIPGGWDVMTVDSNIERTEFRGKFSAYHAARQALASEMTTASSRSVFGATRSWDFSGSVEGWAQDGGTSTVIYSNDSLIHTSTHATNPRFVSPSGLSLSGALSNKIRLRIRRTGGTAWHGNLYYTTTAGPNALHGVSGLFYKKVVADPTIGGAWTTIEWDMAALTAGGTDYVVSTIGQLRFDLGASSSDAFEIDWISVGKIGPAPSYESVAEAKVAADAVTANFNASNDRNSAALVIPTITADGTAVDHTIRTDGAADISFEWAWGGAEGDIDGFLVYVYQTTSSLAYTFGSLPAAETVYTVPANKRAFVLSGAAANLYATFGVQAYRSVDKVINSTGVIKSPLVKPSLAAENPYRPSATVAFAGEVSGTIGGTAASTVVANAAAGKAASDAIPGINSAISDKLSKTSAASLAATITVSTGGSILAGTTTNGAYMSPSGFYGVQGGAVKFSVPISGDPTFGGELTAPSGTLGSLKVVNEVYGGAFTATRGWPASGGGFHLGPSGALFGNANTGKYVDINASGEMTMPGFSHVGGQLTLTAPVIVDPNISGMVLPEFTATLSAGTLTSTGADGSRNLGGRTIAFSGGDAPYSPVSWVATGDNIGTSGNYLTISGDGTDTVNVSGYGQSVALTLRVTGSATDKNGRLAKASFFVSATFGTPA